MCQAGIKPSYISQRLKLTQKYVNKVIFDNKEACEANAEKDEYTDNLEPMVKPLTKWKQLRVMVMLRQSGWQLSGSKVFEKHGCHYSLALIRGNLHVSFGGGDWRLINGLHGFAEASKYLKIANRK